MPTASRHTPPVRRLALGLLAATTLAVSACGTNATFINDYNEATKPLAQLNTEILTSTAPGDVASSERTLDRLSTKMHAVAKRLRALQPPKAAQDELNRLVASLDTTADGAHASVAAMRSDNPRSAVRMLKSLARNVAASAAAEQALKTAVEG
jgi:hypothetical protein